MLETVMCEFTEAQCAVVFARVQENLVASDVRFEVATANSQEKSYQVASGIVLGVVIG